MFLFADDKNDTHTPANVQYKPLPVNKSNVCIEQKTCDKSAKTMVTIGAKGKRAP